MASVESLSDGELRHKLAEYGFPVGPVTETSRKVLIKKLKHLMVQAGRSSDVPATDKWRRSSSRFSSGEEESENEDTKSRLNSSMPPPSSDFKSLRRKSTPKTQYPVTPGRLGRRKEINLRSDLFDTPTTSTPESEPNKIKRSRYSAPAVPQGSVRRSPSRAASSSVFKDGFDTGSDSDIDSQKWKSNTGRPSSSDSPESLPYTSSFVSRLSSVRSKQKSDDSDGENSSVNMLLGFRKSQQSTSSTANTPDSWYTSRTTSAPFQSNFVKRLSGLSTSTSPGASSSPSSIFDVKENDESNVSPNGLFSPSRMSSQSSRPDISREFKTADDEGRFGCNSQLVSMILVVIVAVFFGCLAIMYVTVRSRESVIFRLEDKTSNFPVCPQDTEVDPIDGPYDPDRICIEKPDVIPAIHMAKILHPELYDRAVAHQCAGIQSSVMTHNEAVRFIMKKDKPETGPYLENYLRALKVLLLSNPHWGILVIDTSTGATTEDKEHHRRLVDSGALVVPDPILPVLCYLKIRLLRLIPLVFIFICGLAVMYVVKRYVQYYVRRRERDKLDLYNLVEQIVDVLVNHQKNSPYGRPVFVPVNHVRDEVINRADRERSSALWEKAVRYIRHYESRVRCEMQTIEGEPCEVWRWIPRSVTKHEPVEATATSSVPGASKAALSVSTPRRNNKIWQGQAFDTMSGSPNSLPCSPTPCLKIRHMFEPDVEFAEDWPVRIEDAVLEKCGEQGVRALHISVDRTNREGCVYLKCASQEDAGRAYQALHGWWFDSHLVTVKYLRLERYHERFPEAAGATVTLCPSNNEKLSLQWQGSIEVN